MLIPESGGYSLLMYRYICGEESQTIIVHIILERISYILCSRFTKLLYSIFFMKMTGTARLLDHVSQSQLKALRVLEQYMPELNRYVVTIADISIVPIEICMQPTTVVQHLYDHYRVLVVLLRFPLCENESKLFKLYIQL